MKQNRHCLLINNGLGHTIRAWACIAILFVSLSSCSDYLSKLPESTLNVELDTEDKIAELITGAYPEISYCPFLEARTDNVAKRTNGVHSQLNESMFYWEDYEQEDIDTPLNYWNDCYRGIGQVNKALELLKDYPKTERVKALYGESFLIRAYLHFMLANIWCQPYNPATASDTPGIPYMTKPEKNAVVHYSRGTLKEVYEHIETDLKLGVSLVNDTYYEKPKFHFNKKAAYAFATRFYLFKGDWQNVVDYADYVLGSDAKIMLRPWVKYQETLGFERTSLYHLYTSTTEVANLMLNTVETRYANNVATELYGTTSGSISGALAGSGFENCTDYKRINLTGPYVVTSSPSPISDGQYVAKFDELKTILNSGLRPRGIYSTNVLFTTDEVMLNRMEAKVMLHNYDDAITDMLDYLKVKFDLDPPCFRSQFTWTSTGNYDSYSPYYGLTVSQLALVKVFIDLRRKEFLHEGLRWFDLRRFHIAVSRSSRTAYYRALEKDDLRKTLQIPTEAIKSGLEPNPRSKTIEIE